MSVVPLSPTTLALLQRHFARVVGPIEVAASLAEVAAESRDTRWGNPASHGLWIIGHGRTGDAYAIDVKEGERIVLLSHDLLSEDEVDTPREAAYPIADSLAAALDAARAGNLPADYYAATADEVPEEPEGRVSLDRGGAMMDGLPAPAAARPAILLALFGAGTTVTWDQLEDAFVELEAIERAVLQSRYGLRTGRPSSVEDVANILEISEASVKEEEARGIRWLKRLVARGVH